MLIVAVVLSSLISVYSLLLLARGLLSWTNYSRDSKVYEICFIMTEPILRPIRDFLFRFEVFRTCPIDFSSLVLIILLSVLSRVLFLFV
ncbi:MAG: YggT family protein [Clostridia bacterium]|nr:YggT family protein [Clostridia bacterium]MBQ9703889.1 YggT family protein [Clostridia bacterium]